MVEWRQYVAEEKERQLVAIIQEENDRNAERLREQNKAYNEFCEINALKRYDDRLQTAKWDREEAAQATATARSIKKFKGKIMAIGSTSTGVEIKEVSTHLFTQANNRGPNAEDIADVLTRPLDLGKIRKDGSQKFIGERCTVMINVNTGKVITCWKTSSERLERIRRKEGSKI